MSRQSNTSSSSSKFLKALVGSRLVDLYMKGTGLTGLSPATMVPLAVLLGREAFEAVMFDDGADEIYAEYNQAGGAILESISIPLLDDPYVGSYLTLLGISQLTPETMIPLGLAATIYEFYLKDLI